jgi:hypothetical protein
MAATVLGSHGRAWDRQGRDDGGNNREFSKHLLIPSALGRRDFARADLCTEMLPVPLTQNPNLEFCGAHHFLFVANKGFRIAESVNDQPWPEMAGIEARPCSNMP